MLASIVSFFQMGCIYLHSQEADDEKAKDHELPAQSVQSVDKHARYTTLASKCVCWVDCWIDTCVKVQLRIPIKLSAGTSKDLLMRRVPCVDINSIDKCLFPLDSPLFSKDVLDMAVANDLGSSTTSPTSTSSATSSSTTASLDSTIATSSSSATSSTSPEMLNSSPVSADVTTHQDESRLRAVEVLSRSVVPTGFSCDVPDNGHCMFFAVFGACTQIDLTWERLSSDRISLPRDIFNGMVEFYRKFVLFMRNTQYHLDNQYLLNVLLEIEFEDTRHASPLVWNEYIDWFEFQHADPTRTLPNEAWGGQMASKLLTDFLWEIYRKQLLILDWNWKSTDRDKSLGRSHHHNNNSSSRSKDVATIFIKNHHFAYLRYHGQNSDVMWFDHDSVR